MYACVLIRVGIEALPIVSLSSCRVLTLLPRLAPELFLSRLRRGVFRRRPGLLLRLVLVPVAYPLYSSVCPPLVLLLLSLRRSFLLMVSGPPSRVVGVLWLGCSLSPPRSLSAAIANSRRPIANTEMCASCPVSAPGPAPPCCPARLAASFAAFFLARRSLGSSALFCAFEITPAPEAAPRWAFLFFANGSSLSGDGATTFPSRVATESSLTASSPNRKPIAFAAGESGGAVGAGTCAAGGQGACLAAALYLGRVARVLGAAAAVCTIARQLWS